MLIPDWRCVGAGRCAQQDNIAASTATVLPTLFGAIETALAGAQTLSAVVLGCMVIAIKCKIPVGSYVCVSVQFHPSTRTSKKLMAVFTLDNDRTRTVHFGSAGASDYTQHRDPMRKRQYLARHAPREHWENPTYDGRCACSLDIVEQRNVTFID